MGKRKLGVLRVLAVLLFSLCDNHVRFYNTLKAIPISIGFEEAARKYEQHPRQRDEGY